MGLLSGFLCRRFQSEGIKMKHQKMKFPWNFPTFCEHVFQKYLQTSASVSYGSDIPKNWQLNFGSLFHF